MKFIKSILAVVLAMSFMLVFVACGEDESTNTTTAKSTVTTAAENASVSQTTTASASVSAKATTTKAKVLTKAPEGVSEVANLIARTTNKKGNPSANFIKSLKGYKLKIFYPWTPESKGSVKELKESALSSIDAVEKEFGVTIKEDGKFTSYNETLTADLTAGKADSQVYMVQNYNFASYFKNGFITDLTTGMAKSGVDFKDPWYVSAANAFFNINYKQYAWISFDAEYVFPTVIIYNKSLINKKKLTDPAKLAEKGQWTWDKLSQYAKKLTDSTTKVDGFVSSAETLATAVLAQNNSSFVTVKKGSSPTPNLSSQTVKDALSQMYTWTKTGGICETYKNKDWTYAKTQLASGKVAMLVGSHDYIQNLAAAKTSDDFGVVQFPTKKGTKTYTNYAVPQFPCFIPSKYSKEADKILFLRNELYRQNYRYAQRNFTYQWNKYFDDDDVLDYACNIKYGRKGNTTVFDWSSVCLPNGSNVKTFNSIVTHVRDNNGDVQGAISKYSASITKSFKSVWDGYRITGNV